MSARHTIIWIGLAISLGCVPHTDPPAATAPPAPPAATVATAPLPANPPLETVVATPPPTEPVFPVADNLPAAPTEAVPASQPPAETPTENPTDRVAAKAGVGKQGQSLKNDTGVMVEAAKAYFNVRQRTVFEIEIPKVMSLFEGSEGRKPKSHEEFMSKIIAANQIKLPNLPPGDKYVYDPERGELMVEKRAR